MADYKNNHVLSECLLRRFSDSNSKLVRQDNIGRTLHIPVSGQGYHKGLWRRTSAEFMENLWNVQAEADMYRIFTKLDAGRRLTLNDRKLLIRFLCIHYVRSNEFVRVYQGVHQNEIDKAMRDPRLSFVDRYRLRAQLIREMGIPSSSFEESMREYYDKCLLYLLKFGLDIGVATGENTLILPDGGLVVMDVLRKQAQPSGGVPLLSATHAVMPLGPRHLVGFTSKARKFRYRPLTDEQVSTANRNLMFGIIDAHYSLPPTP